MVCLELVRVVAPINVNGLSVKVTKGEAATIVADTVLNNMDLLSNVIKCALESNAQAPTLASRAQVQARCDVPHCHRPRAARRPSGQGREGQKNDQQQPRQWPGPLSWPCSGTEHPHIQPVPTTQPSYDGAPTRSCAQKVRAFAGLWRVVGVSEALWEPWGLHSQLYTLGISSQNSVGVVFLFHQAPA